MERKSAIFGSMAIVSVITIAVCFVLLTSQQSNAITVNEFFDDLQDKDGDQILMQEDAPCNWTSYNIGDNITIRDRISYVHYNPPMNYTVGGDDTIYITEPNTWFRLNYTGKYQIRYEYLPVRFEFMFEGDRTGDYKVGDYVTVNVTIIEPIGTNGETFIYVLSS
ncbi:MAG: hypothetical protein Q7J68_05290 [Thermoplasmata archaeon]|nr:hypothetical protein [Thermoplasmata archaeon]